MLEARHDAVHGLFDLGLGLAQVLAADAGLLEAGVVFQQLQGGGQVVVQERAGGVTLGLVLFNEFENTAGHLLHAVQLGADGLVGDAVVQLTDLGQDGGVARRRGRGLCGLTLLRLGAVGGIKVRRGGGLGLEEHTAAHVDIGLVTPEALFQHQVHVLLHPAAGHVGGPGQIVQGHGLLLPDGAEVGGKAPLAALHGAAAQQQGRAAGHHAQRIEQLPGKVPPLVVVVGVGQVVADGTEHSHAAQNTQHRADDLHGFGALVGVVRRLCDLADGVLRRGGARLRRLRLGAARRCPLPRIPRPLAHFPAAALAELAQQQDQAHRPGHGKHHRDEYPRTQVVIVLFRRLRLKTVVLVVFVAHASPSPFPRSFRLLPFSSTI